MTMGNLYNLKAMLVKIDHLWSPLENDVGPPQPEFWNIQGFTFFPPEWIGKLSLGGVMLEMLFNLQTDKAVSQLLFKLVPHCLVRISRNSKKACVD